MKYDHESSVTRIQHKVLFQSLMDTARGVAARSDLGPEDRSY